MRGAQHNGSDKIIDYLGGDAGKIDGIDAREAYPIAKRLMIEHRLHERLAIVKGAFNCNRMDVFMVGRGHHATLHLGDPAVGEQYHEVHLGAAAECIDRSPAGVA